MTLGYICNNCHRTQKLRNFVFNCIECGKEICEDCMFGWATCKECAKDKPREFLEKRFNDNL